MAATGFYFGAEIVTIAAAEAAEPARGGRKGDSLGDHARPVFLCGLDPLGRVPGALEFGEKLATLHVSASDRDGHSRGGADHERGGP